MMTQPFSYHKIHEELDSLIPSEVKEKLKNVKGDVEFCKILADNGIDVEKVEKRSRKLVLILIRYVCRRFLTIVLKMLREALKISICWLNADVEMKIVMISHGSSLLQSSMLLRAYIIYIAARYAIHMSRSTRIITYMLMKMMLNTHRHPNNSTVINLLTWIALKRAILLVGFV